MNPKLISKAAVKRAIKVHGLPGNILAAFLLSILGLNRVNKKYDRFSQFHGREFTTALLKEFNVKYDIIEKELEYIPQEGPFIVVSNHPYGAIDGVILINIFSAARPDIKFLTNFILSLIPNLKDFFSQ